MAYFDQQKAQNCKLLHVECAHNGLSGIYAHELCNELLIVGEILEGRQIKRTIDSILNKDAEKKLENSMPNAIIAYRIRNSSNCVSVYYLFFTTAFYSFVRGAKYFFFKPGASGGEKSLARTSWNL